MCNRVFLRHIHQSQSLCFVVFLSQVQLIKPFVVTTVQRMRIKFNLLATARAFKMSVFTVLQVRTFSGYYPSCSQCLRRVYVLPVYKTTQRLAFPICGLYYMPLCSLYCYVYRSLRCECRSCGVVYEEEHLEYRYCLTLVAQQATHDHIEVVVFGESLNPVFGEPAKHLQR